MTQWTRALQRLVETPALVAAVRRLPAVALVEALDTVGLEDSAALLALATDQQILQLADHDLWRPGAKADHFDADRFGVWLEVLCELGPKAAAEKLAALDEDFLAFALSERFWVLQLEELAATQADADPDEARLADKRLESSLGHELGAYWLIAKRHDGWDATLAVLVALDELDSDLVERILARLWAAAAEIVADDGLSTLLSLTDQLESDAAFAREERLGAEGFVTTESARLFLELAWLKTPADADADDPITQHHLRNLAPTVETHVEAASLEEVLATVLGDLPSLPRLESGREERLPILAALATADPDETVVRLGYLVNVLIRASAVDGQRLRPLEAADAVLAYANAGYEMRQDRRVAILPCFRLGWTRVQELALSAARRVDHPRVARAADRQKARVARAVVLDPILRLLVGPCPSLPGAWFGQPAPLYPATDAHFARAHRHLDAWS